jgi:anti-anti-sigma regulatory factor
MAKEVVTTGRLQIEYTSAGSETRVVMRGQIDERTQLVTFADRLADHAVMDLEAVSFINSVGVREWIRFMRNLAQRGVRVTLRRCSEAMIQQMNMIVEVQTGADVESFFAPYECESCGCEASMCLHVNENLAALRSGKAPTMACPECTGTMEFNEIPERYLLFLEHGSLGRRGQAASQ